MSVTGSEFDSSCPSSASFQFSPSPTPTLTPSPSPPPNFMPNPTFSPSPPPPPEPEMPPPPSHTSTQNGDINNQPPRKPRALKSAVWEHFERTEVEGLAKAKCLHCGQFLSGNTKNGTSHLKDHLTLRCSRKISKVDLRQKFLSVNRKADGSTRIENNNFSQEVSRRELATMVVMHEYPLAIVDHIGFRRFVGSLNPNFKIIGRNTLRSDLIKMFVARKLNLKKALEDNVSRIAITTDMWTASNQKKGYMAVTAHYIDEFWGLNHRTLRFAYVPCPHTKETLAQVLLDTLNMYNIAEKVSSVVVDNCTTNDAMMDSLKLKFDSRYVMLRGNFLHMRCSAHILNLVVQDGLDVIGAGIETIRDCVAFWAATPKRIEIFENKAKSLKLSGRKLALDCKTRWNSTFLMLETALPYKNVFASLKLQNPRMKFVVPVTKDWELAEIVCDKLKMFHKVTEIFSGRKYPTSNLFFRQVCEIKLALTSWLSDNQKVIVEMAKKMIEKFDKYWNTINGLLAIAAILDPRNKLECVEFYFNEIYGDMADIEVERVKDFLYDLMVEYQERASSSENSTSSTARGTVLGKRKSSPISLSDEEKLDKWSQVKKTKKKKVIVRSELDHYLEEDALPESSHFDILKFWNIELKYPTLQRIARDIRAIPASTVASESAFSMGGRVVSPYRSRLHADTVEALMCLQNWIIGEYSAYSMENAQACASILEDDDVGESSCGSEVVDADSQDEED